MKINVNYMPICYRTPNCTCVNVDQSKSEFYRKLFSYRLTLLHLCTNCPCNVSPKRSRQSVVSFTFKLINKGETLKTQLITKEETLKPCFDKRRFDVEVLEQWRVLRGRVGEQEEPVNMSFDRRI
jgi:hypothetical protein